jgi:hypothetical protein
MLCCTTKLGIILILLYDKNMRKWFITVRWRSRTMSYNTNIWCKAPDLCFVQIDLYGDRKLCKVLAHLPSGGQGIWRTLIFLSCWRLPKRSTSASGVFSSLILHSSRVVTWDPCYKNYIKAGSLRQQRQRCKKMISHEAATIEKTLQCQSCIEIL